MCALLTVFKHTQSPRENSTLEFRKNSRHPGFQTTNCCQLVLTKANKLSSENSITLPQQAQKYLITRTFLIKPKPWRKTRGEKPPKFNRKPDACLHGGDGGRRAKLLEQLCLLAAVPRQIVINNTIWQTISYIKEKKKKNHSSPGKNCQGLIKYHAFTHPSLPQTMATIQNTTPHSIPAHLELMNCYLVWLETVTIYIFLCGPTQSNLWKYL